MKITVCFTGGGTAGHVFPGLAVMDSLAKFCKNANAGTGVSSDFFWIGSSSGMEKKLLKERGIKFIGIPAGKLRRYFSFRNFTDIFKIMAGIIASLCILLRKRPDIIFSKGGYVSVPSVFAGKILGIPVITHESDYTPGLATRINKRFSKLILLSFEESKKFFEEKYHNKLYFTGNPVRKIFYSANSAAGRKIASVSEDIPVIMVIGGSLGAREINGLIEKLLPELLKNYYVIHQSGNNKISEDISKLPEEFKKRYKRYSFIGNEIADFIAASDIVISRAGAGLIWELAAVGKASILIPLRGKGTRGDQVENAGFLRSKEAAIVLDDEEILPDTLYNTIVSLISNKELIKKMENKIKELSKPESGDYISQKILESTKKQPEIKNE
ncbi:MAG: undecaprenyldiphospho-muramoylpentapeptide beta-N-acetylglucosaminyltransferase [Spirochaetes bacterium]|nr:undecaprenyldiphospho-muramoylpentapeptide beta-N-acetylglucosaminyltransferase [Spirochaetota bacterium]